MATYKVPQDVEAEDKFLVRIAKQFFLAQNQKYTEPSKPCVTSEVQLDLKFNFMLHYNHENNYR